LFTGKLGIIRHVKAKALNMKKFGGGEVEASNKVQPCCLSNTGIKNASKCSQQYISTKCELTENSWMSVYIL
jgi:hypothetical protein